MGLLMNFSIPFGLDWLNFTEINLLRVRSERSQRCTVVDVGGLVDCFISILVLVFSNLQAKWWIRVVIPVKKLFDFIPDKKLDIIGPLLFSDISQLKHFVSS